MKILAIDTATEACSVALNLDGEVKEIYELIPRQHTERILPMVDELLSDSGLQLKQLDALAFNRGPGSFTGVRVATSVVQGLGFSAELPVIGVSSLAALAQQAVREQGIDRVFAAIDARMNEIYWAAYEVSDSGLQLIGNEQVTKTENISLQGDWFCIGSGWDNYQDAIERLAGFSVTGSAENCFPRAADIATLAVDLYHEKSYASADRAMPAYVRNEVTWKKISEQG